MKNILLKESFLLESKTYSTGLIFSILFFINLPYLKSFDFDLMPINIHFYGAVTVGSNIIVYGSNGAYLMTTDRGRTWKQYSLHSNGKIYHMVSESGWVWAIIDKGIVAFSSDGGFNWYKKNVPLDSDEYFVFMLNTSDNLFVRSTKGLYKFDKELNLISNLKDERLSVNFKRIYYNNDYYKIDYHTNRYSLSGPSLIDFYFYRDTLLILSDTGNFNSGIFIVDKDLSNLQFFDVSTKVPSDPYVMEIFTFSDHFVANVWNNLYISNSLSSKWERFLNDTLRVVSTDNYFYTGFFFWNNQLFADVLTTSSHKIFWDRLNSLYNSRVLSPRRYDIKKLDKDETGKLVFSFYGNFFEDKSISPIDVTFDGIGTNFIFPKRKAILDDSIIVVPGCFRTIIQTKDNLKSWELLSCNTGQPELILNDSVFIFLNRNKYSNNPSTSFDSGITFHPTEFGLDTVHRYLIHVYDSTRADTIFSLDTVTYFISSERTQVFTIHPNGKGFWYGTPSLISNNVPRFAYTNDYGKTFKFDTSVFLPYCINMPDMLPVNVSLIKNSFVFPLYFYKQGNKNFHSHIVYIDTSFTRYYVLDISPYILNLQIYPLDLNHFIMFSLNVDSVVPGKTTFEIRESLDSGKTSIKLYELADVSEMTQYYVHNQDSIFFSVYPPAVYLFDVKRRELHKLYENENISKALLMVIGDRFYIVGDGIFLENTDRSDLTQWREGEWDYGKPNFESVIFRGNVAIAGLSDSLRPFNYYKITLKKQEPSVVKEPTIEKRYYTTHFWASEPYPQPAKVRVKARVAWDGSCDLREAIDGVYDTMGRKVEGKERIRVDARNTTSGELEWECSGVPAGIYFILIRWRGGSETVPVVVE